MVKGLYGPIKEKFLIAQMAFVLLVSSLFVDKSLKTHTNAQMLLGVVKAHS
jgi:hypothetical protein